MRGRSTVRDILILAYFKFYKTKHLNSVPAKGKPPLWNATWTDELKHDLLLKYDKFARPAQHTNVTEVTFKVTILHIEVDEAKSMMIINGWTHIQWLDEKLRWNQSDYGGISKIHVADHEVWQPDIVLYNNALGNNIDHYGHTHCIVYSNGEVLWVPPSQFSVYCDLDLSKWPYDRHTCRLFFGSWVHGGEQIYLKRKGNSSDSDSEVKGEPGKWALLSLMEIEHTKYYSCCSEPYYNIEIFLTIERRSPEYSAVVFTPALVCVMLILSVFWLQPSCSERVVISGVTAVIDTIFLVYFAYRLPAMGTNIPLIVKFYSYHLLLVCLSLVVTIALRNVPRSVPLPWAIHRFLNGRLPALLGLKSTQVTICLHAPTNHLQLTRGQYRMAIVTAETRWRQNRRERKE
ncbi:hypothetical protein J6590_060218 [Homalodisca vitripennis]|nr:hypothetical protein J6590_060218 [Homalodisca vitripennis]